MSDVVGAAPPFEGYFRAEYAAVVALGAAMTGDRGAGEDLAQEAMRITHARWAEVSGYERPGAFTRRVLANLAANERRRRGRERGALVRLAGRAELAPLPSPAAELDPVWGEVARLPDRQRAAVALRYVDDLDTPEIAAVLGCSEATVRVHLHRAHRRLAERLGHLPEPARTDLEVPS